ncbi:MAG: ABC transporter permease [Sulfolobales archaeon]
MTLIKYIVRKVLVMFLIFVTSMTIFFFFFRVAPVALGGGNPLAPAKAAFDPLLASVGSAIQGNPSAATWVGYTSSLYALNRPLIPDQLIAFYKNIFTFNFGRSLYTQRPVEIEILIRLPYTLSIYVVGVLLPIVVGYYLALYAIKYRGRILDLIITVSSLISYTVPPYVLLLIIYYFLAYLPKVRFGIGIFPLPVRAPIISPATTVEELFYLTWYVIPIYISLVLTSFGQWAYYIRQLVVSEAEKDYVVSARARGLEEKIIIRREMIPNVRPPLMTALAYSIPTVFGGSVVLEMLTSWPGVASYAYQALSVGDFPAIIAFYTISVALIIISLLLTDILIAIIDPRTRLT